MEDSIVERVPNPRVELLAKLLLAVAAPIVLIFMIEGLAFLWERGQNSGMYAWELVASRRVDLIEYEGQGAGYTLMKPNARYQWGHIPVEINSHGLRGPEVAFDKPSGTYRILNLGDSIVMGWGVAFEDTYGNRLETLLNDQAGSKVEYQVINAGVPGWNPENYRAYYAAEGWKFEPDLVVLGITVVNDIYGPNALDRSNSPPFIEWMRQNTYIWPFLSIQMQWVRARAEGQDRIGVIDPPTRASSYFPLDRNHSRWEAISTEITAIEKQARVQGAAFLLVIFPMEYQVLDPQYETLAQEVLVEMADSNGIAVLDLLDDFQAACLQKLGAPCTLEDRYLFADVWMHPSPLGHELTASAILENLANNGIAVDPGSN